MTHMHNRSEDNWEDLLDAIIFGSNKNFTMTERKISDLYSNNLDKDLPSTVSHTYSNFGVQYNLNKKSYRSPEFHKDTDLLVSGCSITYGEGLPKEAMWSEMVAEEMQLSHANLSKSGDSVVGQALRIFAYFKEFGHPKYIYALFPDFGRMLFPSNEKQFMPTVLMNQKKSDPEPKSFWDRFFLANAFFGNWMPDTKVSIRPHMAENIMTPEVSHFYSAQMIMILEQYCALAGIKFAWSLWDGKQYDALKITSSNSYNGLVDIKINNWYMDFQLISDCYSEYNNRIMCHEDLRLKHRTVFDLALDRSPGPQNAHWGAHRNRHVADIVKNIIVEWKNEGY